MILEVMWYEPLYDTNELILFVDQLEKWERLSEFLLINANNNKVAIGRLFLLFLSFFSFESSQLLSVAWAFAPGFELT